MKKKQTVGERGKRKTRKLVFISHQVTNISLIMIGLNVKPIRKYFVSMMTESEQNVKDIIL